MRRISLAGLDPKPAVIYLGSVNSLYGTGLGFSSHKQMMTLLDKDPTPWFTHCQPCQFNKIYQKTGDLRIGCPGGVRYLTPRGQDSCYFDNSTRVVSRSQRCKLVDSRQLNWKPDVEFPFLVTLPDYVLVNSVGYDESAYNLKAFLPKPDSETLDDLWKGIPFILSNTNDHGSVCLGTTTRNLSWFNWGQIQNAYLNGKRNYDWTEYWRDRDIEGLSTLLEYATELSRKGANFVNKFQHYRWENWQREVFQGVNWDNKYILPFDESYEAILFDRDNSRFYLELTGGIFKTVPDLEVVELPNE